MSMGWLDSFLYRSHARMERRPAGCSFVRACIWATTPLRFDGTHTPVAERHPVMLSAPRTGSVLMLCCAAGAAARYERPVKFRVSRAPMPAPHVGQSERRSRSLLISISASLAANLRTPLQLVRLRARRTRTDCWPRYKFCKNTYGTAKIPTVLYDCTSRGTRLTNTPSTKFTVRYKFSGFVALPIRYGAGYGTVYLRAVRSSIPLRRLRTQVMIVDCVAARSGGHRNNRLLPI